MTDKQLMQMALDALEHGLPIIEDFGGKEQLQLQHKAIAVLYEALRAALAHPEQEPVAWRTFDGEGNYEFRDYDMNENYAEEWNQRNPNHKGWVEPLYTVPPQRDDAPAKAVEWQGLTDEEYETMAEHYVTNCYFDTLKYARAIEAKLREKNNA